MSNPHGDASILVDALRDPETVRQLGSDGWTALLAIARAEQLIGSLAYRLEGQPMPGGVAAILEDARLNAEYQRRSALWEANRAAAALAGYDGKVVLMKGTAYVAADMKAGIGRHIGDLDIMVAEGDLPLVEEKLLAAGWEWVKEDEYDDAYYREHMHELPPLIHKERDRMIDVHHTILPKTARPKPDAEAMLEDAVPVNTVSPEPVEGRAISLSIFCPEDMVLHCTAHLIADGELDGGLRNLWDFHCLIEAMFASVMDGNEPPDPIWVHDQTLGPLYRRAKQHDLEAALRRAVRLADYCFRTCKSELALSDRLFLRRLLARNGYGQPTRKLTRLGFYIRSHWLRMPPFMLARHLWTKWRMGRKKSASDAG